MGNIKLLLGPKAGASPPSPPADGLGPGPLWYANGGVGGSGYTDEIPDIAALEAAREVPGARPAPTNQCMFPDERIFLDKMALPFQVVLEDTDPASTNYGKPVPCELVVWNEGNSQVVGARTTRSWLNVHETITWFADQHWVDIALPTDFLDAVPNSPGASIHLYTEARPLDPNYASRWAGPFIFFPRNETAIVRKKLAKTAGAGVDVTTMTAYYSTIGSEYVSTGRAVFCEVVDTEKDWFLARATVSYVCPWLSECYPGPDLVTGELCTYQLGDKALFPTTVGGYSSPGINKLCFIGHKHDTGATGGIVARDANTTHFVEIDHETFCSGFPLSVTVNGTPYTEYGRGTGSASTVRGRQPGYPLSLGGGGTPKFVSICGNYHDVPTNALIMHHTAMLPIIDDVSGSAIQDMRGSIYGAQVSKLGGFYSGLCTRQGDRNPGMSLTPISGAAYCAYEKNGGVGSDKQTSPNQALTAQWILYVGADEASAVPTPFDTLQFKSVAALVAQINATGQWLAVDTTDPDYRLDCTHLSRDDLSQNAPIPKTQITGAQDFHVILDAHASCFTLNVSSGIRRNISMLHCTFFNYCGAGTLSMSSNKVLTYVDIYFEGCVFRDAQGYTDRQGNPQTVGIEPGYMTGHADGLGVTYCTFSSVSGTSGNGLQFGPPDDGWRTKLNAVIGYSYGQFGNLPPSGMGATGIVSPYQGLPAGYTNSKYLGVIGTSFPDTSVFDNPADPTSPTFVPINENARTPDGVNWAGAYNGDTGLRQE